METPSYFIEAEEALREAGEFIAAAKVHAVVGDQVRNLNDAEAEIENALSCLAEVRQVMDFTESRCLGCEDYFEIDDLNDKRLCEDCAKK